MRNVIALIGIGPLVGCPPDPPEAHIQFVCLDAECSSMQFDAYESVDADDYAWYLDGALVSNAAELQLDIGLDTLREIELEVGNTGGVDTTTVYAAGLSLENVDPTLPQPAGIVLTVVAGIVACDTNAVITTVGGCFSAPATLEQRVRVRDVNGSHIHSLMYDKALDDVTQYGDAVGAAWQNLGAGGTLTFGPQGGPVNSSNYGSTQYRALATASQSHLTSWIPVASGDILEMRGRHLEYYEDPEQQALDALRIDCSSGSLSVALAPGDF